MRCHRDEPTVGILTVSPPALFYDHDCLEMLGSHYRKLRDVLIGKLGGGPAPPAEPGPPGPHASLEDILRSAE